MQARKLKVHCKKVLGILGYRYNASNNIISILQIFLMICMDNGLMIFNHYNALSLKNKRLPWASNRQNKFLFMLSCAALTWVCIRNFPALICVIKFISEIKKRCFWGCDLSQTIVKCTIVCDGENIS